MSENKVQAKAGQYLTFNIDGGSYGLPIVVVREINHIREITPVPQTDEFIVGVINLRGKVIPVVDLKLKFGIGRTTFTKETCTIVFETHQGPVGAIVDSVSDVLELTQNQIEPPPKMGDEDMSFILGMGKINEKVVILINIVAAISSSTTIRTAKATLSAAS